MLSNELLVSMLVSNDQIPTADAIILLEGNDFTARANRAVKLFKELMAPRIVITGEDPKKNLWWPVISQCVPEDAIMGEHASRNTREQAVNVMQLVAEHGWNRLLLVGSHFHQLRAFLTFLRAMKEAELSIKIYNAPARDIPWFPSHVELLEGEYRKIMAYGPHVASYQEALEYFQIRN